MNTILAADGNAYDLRSVDDVYMLAYVTAHSLRRTPNFNGVVGEANEYPFDAGRHDVAIRLAWDMGFEDGVGDEDTKEGTPTKRGWGWG